MSDLHTSTEAVYPILGCLSEIQKFLKKMGTNTSWNPVSAVQQQFLKEYRIDEKELASLKEILEGKSSNVVEEINSWIKSRGFDIQLTEQGSGAVYVASILKVGIAWKLAGKKGVFDILGKQYPAVRIEAEDDSVELFGDSKIHNHPVVKLLTKTDEVVYMSPIDEMPKGLFGINKKVEELRAITQNQKNSIGCGGVKFPMIDYNEEVDVSWLCGLQASCDHFIGEAKQQTKFRMNEIGAVAESAVAVALYRCCVPDTKNWFIIDKPFILWIDRQIKKERESFTFFPRKVLQTPLFAGIFCQDVWKAPEAL